MKILQIGGTGFLGSHIADRLINRNHELTIISRNPDNEMSFDKSKVIFIKGNILELDKLTISERYDVLVYTAMPPFKPGHITTKKFKYLEKITRQYFENTISFAKSLKCPLILTSGASFETKGNEIADETWIVARKGMAMLGKCYDELIEKLKAEKSIPLIEMLPSQIYGKGGMFKKMIHMAEKGKLVLLGDGKNYLPRIHVDDCADAYVLAIEKLPIGKRFIISDNESVSVKDFTQYFAKVFEVKYLIKIPKFILRLVVGKYVYQTLTMNTKVSNKLLKKELGWTLKYPTFREGLKSLKM